MKSVGRTVQIALWPLIALLAGCPGAARVEPGAVQADIASPRTSTSTGDVSVATGGKVTQITFQSMAGKAGWAAMPLTLIGWIAASIQARRRERAADALIESIEAAGSAAKIVKSHIANRKIEYIDKRVEQLSKEHGWGSYGFDA